MSVTPVNSIKSKENQEQKEGKKRHEDQDTRI